MKLKANDTLFISSVKSDNILPGEEFEVGEDQGNDLVKRGLATKVAPAPKNKMAPSPANKGGAAASSRPSPKSSKGKAK